MAKTDKLVELMQLLLGAGAPYSKAELAVHLGVSERSVMRYLAVLDELLPFCFLEHGAHGFRVRSIHTELPIGESWLSESTATLLGYQKDLAYAKSKENQNMVHLSYTRSKAFLATIRFALRSGIYLECDYQPLGEGKRFCVVPLSAYIDYGVIYIVAYSETHQKRITLAVDKILGLRVLSKRMSRSELKDHRKYVYSAWGKMICEQDPFWVHFVVGEDIHRYFIKSPLHDTQIIERQPDGFHVRLRVHRAHEFITWSLRFGNSLRILEPDFLVQALLEYLRDVASTYQISEPSQSEATFLV